MDCHNGLVSSTIAHDNSINSIKQRTELIQTDMLESICNEIINLDHKIIFAGIIDFKGTVLVQNKKIQWEILDPKEQEILLAQIALGNRMKKAYDKYFGAINFTISYSDKLVSIDFPISEEILSVFVQKDLNVFQLAFLISNLIKIKFNQSEMKHNAK